jgi:phosphoribosyl 1,2-cyclic phosphodiesterase
MRLYALGSGSKGNAFALATEDGVLLIDAGFSAKELCRRAEQAELSLDRLIGVVLTHEHGDHASGASRLARIFGVPIAGTFGTLQAMASTIDGVATVQLRASSLTELGPFTLGCCRTLHDAAEPVALTVEASGVRIGVAYDFGRSTSGLRYLFRELDAVVLESNYDEVMLRTSRYPVSVQHRIAGSGGHLSNHGAAQLLTEIGAEQLTLAVLAHLSQQCNAPEVARATVEPVLRRNGFRGRLEVALQDAPVGPFPIIPAERPAHQTELVFDEESTV